MATLKNVGDNLDMLESAAKSQRRGALRGLRLQRVALELNLAGSQRQHAGDQIECRALARAVGADQPDDAAALNLEADIVDCDQTAEGFSRALRLQQRRSRRR